jgi:hypothetical protein
MNRGNSIIAAAYSAYRSRRIGGFVGDEWYRRLRWQWWSGFQG